MLNNNQFNTCSDCANKQSSPKLERAWYYCPLVVDEIPNGIVREDYDAIDCERKGRFISKWITKINNKKYIKK